MDHSRKLSYDEHVAAYRKRFNCEPSIDFKWGWEAALAQQAQPGILACGRARRHEHHPAHIWSVGNDHDPSIEPVTCLGYEATETRI